MQKNARGIYHGTAATKGDYVIHKKGGTYHPGSATYYVDRVDAGGTHQTIGTTRGFSSIADAIQGARDNAHTRGGRNGVIFEQRGDELVQVHAISAHRQNARPLKRNSSLGSGGIHDDPELLQQLVQMEAESMELANYKDADVTPEVLRVAKEYDAALQWALDEVVTRFPPKNGASADDLWNANAPYLVLMTLRGEGVGIWDGDWDHFYGRDDIKKVQALLERKLGLYTSSGGGSGKLGDALANAASETCGDPDYSPNASRARPKGSAGHYVDQGDPVFIIGDYVERKDSKGEGKVVDIGTKRGTIEYFVKLNNGDKLWFNESELKVPAHWKNGRREEPDETAARELSLYIENEYDLVGAPNSQGKAIEKNLLKKIKNGTFNLELSEKAWMYLMETGAKKYCKEYADAREWSKVFNKPTRELVAHEFATTFAEENGAKSMARNANIEIEEFDAPAEWASAFINGDTSGLSEESLEEFETWVKDNPELGWVVDASEEAHIGRWNGLQTELLTYTAHVQEAGGAEDLEPNARIAEIRKAGVTTYSDSGQVTAYVEGIDTRGKTFRTEGSPDNSHMQALLSRAKREGISVKKETW